MKIFIWRYCENWGSPFSGLFVNYCNNLSSFICYW